MNTPKVMLASLVRVDAPTFSLVIQSHKFLKGVAQRLYIDDNTDKGTSAILAAQDATTRPASAIVEPLDTEYRTEHTHIWEKDRISRVTRMRNAVIEEFLKTDCTHLFFTDADLVVHPETVAHLLTLNKAVVSPIFWTRWEPKSALAPQTWDCHPYGHWNAERVLRMREKGTYDVGGLGACTLIRRDVLERGISYEHIPALNMEGEDRHFCIRCQAHGFELFGDTYYPPFHVYRKEQLDEAQIWFEQGCDPTYFAEAWLTKEWEQHVEGVCNLARRGEKRKSLALCLPGEHFSASWVMGLIDSLPALNNEFDMQVVNVFSSNPSVTRQTITRSLLEGGHVFDYALWVDDDNVLSQERVKLLLEVMEAYPDIDIVAGWCDISRSQYDFGDNKVSCGTFDEHGKCINLTHEEVENASGLVSIEWTGFPCVLMRGKLLQELGPKSFSSIADESLEWGFFGEDVSFCKRAKDAGAVMVMDPRVRLPHLKLRDANKANRENVGQTQNVRKEEK